MLCKNVGKDKLLACHESACCQAQRSWRLAGYGPAGLCWPMIDAQPLRRAHLIAIADCHAPVWPRSRSCWPGLRCGPIRVRSQQRPAQGASAVIVYIYLNAAAGRIESLVRLEEHGDGGHGRHEHGSHTGAGSAGVRLVNFVDHLGRLS